MNETEMKFSEMLEWASRREHKGEDVGSAYEWIMKYGKMYDGVNSKCMYTESKPRKSKKKRVVVAILGVAEI